MQGAARIREDIARAHGTDILRATVGTRVSPALVLAIISVESAGRVDAVSSAGAAGPPVPGSGPSPATGA